MPRVTAIQNSMTAGEVSSQMKGRTDFPKYRNALDKGRNFLIYPHGGGFRRPGGRFVAEAKYANRQAGLLKFEFSVVQAYCLEIGHYYIRFFMNEGQIYGGTGSELLNFGNFNSATGWTTGTGWSISGGEASCDGSQTAASELKRTTNTALVAGEDYYVVYTITGRSAGTITPKLGTGAGTTRNAAGVYAEKITAAGSGTLYFSMEADASFVGSVDNISVRVYGPHEVITPWDEDEAQELMFCQSADVLYIFHADYEPRMLSRLGHTVWTLEEVPFIDGPYLDIQDPYATLTPSGTSGTVTVTSSVAVFTSQMVGTMLRWKADDDKWYWFEIKTVSSSTTITAEVMGYAGLDYGVLPNTNASGPFRIAAWGEHEGYPAAGCFVDDRLVCGYTDMQPQTIWGSVTGDYENYAPGDEDADAVTFTLGAQEVNSIIWLCPGRKLAVGTLGAEFADISTSGPMTPTNPPELKRQTTAGCHPVAAQLINDVVVYVQRHGKRLREYAYVWQNDNYGSNDLSLLANHLTKEVLTGLAYQAYPHSQIWCTTAAGSLLTCTYYRQEEVIAWTKHETPGSYKSVAVVPGNDRDVVWTLVEREVNGQVKQFVEFIEDQPEQTEDSFYLDCGLTYLEATPITAVGRATQLTITAPGHELVVGELATVVGALADDGDNETADYEQLNHVKFKVSAVSGDVVTLTDEDGNNVNSVGWPIYYGGGELRQRAQTIWGMDHLIGAQVEALADGSPHQPLTVAADGSITLDYPASHVHVGLHKPAYLHTLPQDIGSMDGTAMGKIQRIHAVAVLFDDTVGGKIGASLDDLEPITLRSSNDLMDRPVPLYSGIETISFNGTYERGATVWIVQDQPLPMTVNAIVTQLTTEDM